MVSKLLPVIMAGGSGTRLWPLSRSKYPKQFLKLLGDSTMLQATFARLKGLDIADPLVIGNEDHRFIIAEQLRTAKFRHGGIILEPFGRNTAPAVALAALQATAKGADPLLLVLAADHLIQDVPGFHKAIHLAEKHAEEGALVTFGIQPTHAETGYGYIKTNDIVESGSPVVQFVEKPDQKTAEGYVASKKFLWNSGMFLFKASRYLEELEKFRPDILAVCKKSMADNTQDKDFLRINESVFAECPDDSIDYAVMEKTGKAIVIPMSVGWSDIGSWSSLWDVSEKDSKGNVVDEQVILQDCSNTLVKTDDKLVCLLGVENLIVINTKDAVLVAHKDKVQDIKKIVNTLKNEGLPQHEFHREVHRPWGKYDSIDVGERHQVKCITVNPGEKLSIQMHHHRAEHWVVVSGTAKVTNGDKTYLVAENESTYIPIGQIHALENPGKLVLKMIEVQSGSYLGEDDIVRFSDKYGRVV